ncbi:MAG: DedA family protein [Planctomycetes bacterium]|nr:DedA family protein [Planctomycetota bacterium]
MELLHTLLDYVLHLDAHLNEWAAQMGPWLYVLLFAIVFCETGLVVTPFLPGDSLLFAVGALSATEGSPIDVTNVSVLLIVAAVLGDAVNYAIGKYLGPKVFTGKSRFLKREHLERTHAFYEKHGGKTIILARFIPIIRTFAPFVAGIGSMSYRRFFAYNVIGAIAWVLIFTISGNVFGNLEVVKRNFHIVILAIIVISVLPAVWEVLKARKQSKAGA